MSNLSTARVPCPLCRTGAKLRWPDNSFFQCPSCGLLFRENSATHLDDLYSTGWVDPGSHTQLTGETDPALAGVYLANLARDLNREDFRGLRILDFGAGRGAMLTALQESGVEAVGVEPYGHEFLRAKGFTAYPSVGDLPSGMKFDGVISIDVAEHLQDVRVAFSALKGILNERGWIYLATPNAAGIKARVYGNRWSEVLNPSHLSLFSPRTLTTVLKASGFSNPRRLKWFIDYGRNPLVSILHWLLQFLRIDGELRYLAKR